MKTYTIKKTINSTRLHEELMESGIVVITVRAFDKGGEALTDDKADDIIVKEIIEKHSGEPNLNEKLDKTDLAKSLIAAHNEILWSQINNTRPPEWAIKFIEMAHKKIKELEEK